jgi:hypothetical protein
MSSLLGSVDPLFSHGVNSFMPLMVLIKILVW